MRIDFIGLGGARCGSTWIANCLREHPEVSMSNIKELNYFSRTRAFNTKSEYEIRGIKGYFDAFKECDEKKVVGEYSTHYLPDPKVMNIIKKHFPNVKIIVSLRDPVERAYSDYLINRYFILNEKDEFDVAFFKRRRSYFDNYMDKGFYYKQLKPYFDNFRRKNIKVVVFEDVKKDSKKFIQDIYKFLGIDSNYVPKILNEKINPFSITKYVVIRRFMNAISYIAHVLEKMGFGRFLSFIKRKLNLGGTYWTYYDKNIIYTKKPKLDPEVKKKLMKVYKEDIKKVEKLIGRKLSHWK